MNTTKNSPNRTTAPRGLRYLDGRIEPTLAPSVAPAANGHDSRVEPRLGLPIPQQVAPRR